MLTPYDEFPIHQAPPPFSHVPSTDYAWDDGYWFGVFNADEKLFLGTYMRVNPNTDMIGGGALLNVAGYQTTVAFNPGTKILKKAAFHLTDVQGRQWRQVFDIDTPPWIVQPMGAFPGSWKDGFNTGTSVGNMVGPEYLARVTTYAPVGSVSTGVSQVELFINGAYHPYGIE